MALQPYLSDAEAREWLRLGAGEDPTMLAASLAAATGMVIAYLGFDAVEGQTTETIHTSHSARVFPSRRPIVSVASLVCGLTNQAIPATHDGSCVWRQDNQRFSAMGTVTLTYTAGFDPASTDFAPVKLATRIALQAAWGAVQLDPNLSGENMGGSFSGSYAPQGPGALPVGARNLLEHLKRRF